MPYRVSGAPELQLALDFVNAEQALRAAAEAVPAGIGWLEAGTPLIKAEGLEVVRRLRAAHPDPVLVADMKVMDAGRIEVEAAQKAGADVVTVLGAATDATLGECVEAGRHMGIAVCCDLVSVADPVARAARAAEIGVDLVSVHTPIDRQMEGEDAFELLAAVVAAVEVPVACAGGLSAATAADAVAAGARIVIVGGAITKSPDNRSAATEILAVLAGARPPEDQELYRRLGADRIREVLSRVSTPNLSDAMHRGGALRGLVDRNPGRLFAGPARTVVAAPGDWSKPVQAIDRCAPGEVLVIDAAGREPALWGGLASRTARARGLAGVVIHGACRDLEEIAGGELPLWSTHACPDAGEPKGVGAFDLTVSFGSRTIRPGDWIVGDASGCVVVPAENAVGIANRAQDVMERERRFAAEIDAGRTLAEIAELGKWESVRLKAEG